MSMFGLKELREARGLSQVRLAIDLNINQNSVSRYESGARGGLQHAYRHSGLL